MAEMTLSHFTKAETLEPYSVAQEIPRMKPRGLWVSVDGERDWPEWCAEEEFGIGPNRFIVTLAADANILHLTTAEEITEFHAEYRSGNDDFYLDHQRVAEKYQGLIIAPYQWSLRWDGPSWYYSWDVASGCIWDAAAIEAVRRA